jgi:uncharacterized protein DUF2652/polyketide cyclase/dehydrase/lipid transport protein
MATVASSRKVPDWIRLQAVNGVERGCLIIADIGGYTKYLTGVELEHSTDIIADLINTVVDQMSGVFTLSKLEGDAVFSYAPDAQAAEGASVVTAIESCYFAFRKRQGQIDRATSCTCDACSRIPSLDLKFVVHHGKYAIREMAGSNELVGSDVIVVHRLLKNDIKATTGLNGYAFFSGDCLEHYGLDSSALTLAPHTETYDDVGEIPGWVLDLESRWTEEQERRDVVVSPEDPKSMTLTYDMPGPAALVWEHLTSPTKRLAWQEDTLDLKQTNPRGTRGVGTTNHCVHGKSSVYEEILDWKPYRYMTERSTTPMGPMLMMFNLRQSDDAARTTVVVRIKPEGGLKQKLMLRAFGKKMTEGFDKGMANLVGILEAELKEPAPTPG